MLKSFEKQKIGANGEIAYISVKRYLTLLVDFFRGSQTFNK